MDKLSVSPEDGSSGALSGNAKSPQKRSRVLLSCAPCRASKLKCDREQPCSQCSKKARVDLCVYAPKPLKKKPVKGMSARLKRLEGMVREMMENEDDQASLPRLEAGLADNELMKGKVVKGGRGGKGTNYVGATHCMAVLEDIEDLKSYFEDGDEEQDEENPPDDEMDPGEFLLFSRGAPRSREDLLAQIPERKIADRLLVRYFSTNSPSLHVTHRPSFGRVYDKFWQNPDEVNLHWIAQLFMMLSLGVVFSSYAAPHEVEGDSPIPVFDRVRHYRSCAAWALIWGKYTQPTSYTLPALLLYVESHFILNRTVQTNCYLLSAVVMRLMLKMGLHRDPSKLANLTPFESEMRRRLWNMAVQIELLVAFHMGLPSMQTGIETDVALPLHLQDEDFDEDSTELPAERPFTYHTSMTYPILKSNIIRVFAQIARQAHSLTVPKYADIMRVDQMLQGTWKAIPSFMRVRPLSECIGDDPSLLVQRFGLSAIYNKSRCVLHRRFLSEPVPNAEHNYSRRQCLEGADYLLRYQRTLFDATQPGGILSQTGWGVTSLSVHDFLLAAMILFVIVQSEHYEENGAAQSWLGPGENGPSKEELRSLIRGSHTIWVEVAASTTEVRKTVDILAVMLAKLGRPVEPSRGTPVSIPSVSKSSASSGGDEFSSAAVSSSTIENAMDVFSTFNVQGNNSTLPGDAGFSQGQNGMSGSDFMKGGAVSSTDIDMAAMDNPMLNFDTSWMPSGNNMEWRFFDVDLGQTVTGVDGNATNGQGFMERYPMDGVDVIDTSGWLPNIS